MVLAGVIVLRRPIGRIRRVAPRQHVGGADAAQKATRRRQAAGDLCENGRDEGSCCNAVAEARVQIGEEADGQRAEGVRNLRTGCEFAAAEEVDNVASKGNDDHDGHLAPFGLVEDTDAEDEWRDKGKGDVRVHGVLALRLRHGVAVEEAPESRTDGNAESKEEGVDDGVNDANGTRNNSPRLELQG